jgi:hypothetical protein
VDALVQGGDVLFALGGLGGGVGGELRGEEGGVVRRCRYASRI